MSELAVLQVLGRSAGGIARHVAGVVDALDGNGLRVDVAGPGDLPVDMPKPVIPLEIPDGVRGHSFAVRRLSSYLLQGDYDVVHAHGLRAGIDAGFAAGRLDVPCLLTVHNLVRPDVAGRVRALFYRWAEPLSVRMSAHTFAVSEDIARRLRKVSPRRAHRIEVLYLGVGDPPRTTLSPDEVRKSLELDAGAPLIVTASRLSAQKAVAVMLRALTLLPDEVSLVVLGQGPDEAQLKNEALALGLDSRIRWLGFRHDVADFLAAADVFCLSSNWEGVPLAAQEAMLLGTPVVSTDVGGMRELVTDGATGRLVPKGDAAALASALGEMLGSKERARLYAQAGASDLRRRFSTERMLSRLREAYEWHAG